MKILKKLCAGLLSVVMLTGTIATLPPDAILRYTPIVASADETEAESGEIFEVDSCTYERTGTDTATLRFISQANLTPSPFKLLLPGTVRHPDGTIMKVTRLAAGALKGKAWVKDQYGKSEQINILARYSRDVYVPEEMNVIEDGAFEQFTVMRRLIFEGKNTLELGSNAASHCGQLVVVDFGSRKVTSLGDHALADNPYLNKIDLKRIVGTSDLTKFGTGVFANDRSLEQVTFSERLPISAEMFKGCTGLRTVTLEQGAFDIYAGAFEGCTALKTVDFGAKRSISFGERAFMNCTNLTELKVKETETNGKYFDGFGIGDYAFAGCEKLKSFYYKSYVREIGAYAFQNCAALKEVWFKNSSDGTLPLIFGTGAFQGAGLVSFHLNDWLNVGESMFEDCTKLTELPTISCVGKRGFANCTALTEMTITASAEGVKHRNFLGILEAEAFAGCTGLETVRLDGYNIQVNAFAFSGSNVKATPHKARLSAWH